MAKRLGRRKGSRNNGYFFRKGRGWYTKDSGRFVPLVDADGMHLQAADVSKDILESSYVRYRAARLGTGKAKADTFVANPCESDAITIREICILYLAEAETNYAAETYTVRANTLFDFCFGLPGRFREKPGKTPRVPKKSDKIHNGFGKLLVSDLKPYHVKEWLHAHPRWKGCQRSRIQALKRALNYAVEIKKIPVNPIRGFKTPKTNSRITYLTPDQEKAICEIACSDFATAIKVCIRTGARPGCEFARVTARHIRDMGDRMEWEFQPKESKTKKLRTIRVMDPEILAIVRRQMELHPRGPIFRNTLGDPWTRESLRHQFRRVNERLKTKRGIELDKDACMYSCRHTYAKRTLQGFWTGKVTNIETLAELMGNSPNVCRDHYLRWCASYTQPLWEAC